MLKRRDAIITIAPATYVPIFSAAAGFPPSFPLTIKIPSTEARRPIPARTSGNNAAVCSSNDPP